MAEELKVMYPVINKINKIHNIQGIMTTCGILHKQANIIKTDEEEISYLEEIETYIGNLYCSQITKIKLKKQQIEKAKKFDMSKIQNLPDDMIYEISTWIQPELQYTKKFMVLQKFQTSISGNWEMELFLVKLPKALLIDLIKDKCNIYSSMYCKTSHQKEKWCRMMIEELSKLVGEQRGNIRIDKHLAIMNDEYGSDKNIDKWFKLFLHIQTYKKYRQELEIDDKIIIGKLNKLKNTKISVK
jgi:hypothetical protein